MYPIIMAHVNDKAEPGSFSQVSGGCCSNWGWFNGRAPRGLRCDDQIWRLYPFCVAGSDQSSAVRWSFLGIEELELLPAARFLPP